MTVRENVEYGLRVKGVSRPRAPRSAPTRCSSASASPGLGCRRPLQLSGGQRQRVALARAIVNGPPVLLLDEPLGALDLKLRQEMQIFLKELQRELGITFVYVTHDQEEALTMSDRLAVFNEGRIEQVGSPAEVYEHPATRVRRGLRRRLQRARARRAGASRPPGEDPDERPRHGGRRGRSRQRRSSTSAWSRATSSSWTRGGELVVVRQNLETSSHAGARGAGQPRPPRRGGRSTPTRSARRAHEEDSEGRTCSSPRSRRRCACRRRASPPANGLPTAVGKGEGEGALNLIEWAAYTDPSFAKPFERKTGCKIQRKDAGSSNEMVALMRSGGGGGGGQYDLVSASGDASLRLIYGGDVQPVNVKLIPELEELPAGAQVAGPQHRQGRALRRLGPVGAEHAHLQHEEGEARPDQWAAIYSSKYKGRITVPNNPIQIADAALYLMKTQAEPRDQGSVRADAGPAGGGRGPAREAEAAAQALLDAPRPTRSPTSRTATSSSAPGWPYQTLQLAGRARPRSRSRPAARARRAGPTRGCSRSRRRTRTAPTSGCST